MKCYSAQADGRHKLVINEIKPTKGNIRGLGVGDRRGIYTPGWLEQTPNFFGGVKESWLADFSGKQGTSGTSGDLFLTQKNYPVFMAIHIYKFEANKSSSWCAASTCALAVHTSICALRCTRIGFSSSCQSVHPASHRPMIPGKLAKLWQFWIWVRLMQVGSRCKYSINQVVENSCRILLVTCADILLKGKFWKSKKTLYCQPNLQWRKLWF